MKPARPTGLRQEVEVCIGNAGTPVGRLSYARQGPREHSAFAYAQAWLADPSRFEISPDLPLQAGHVTRRPTSPADSVFPFALADTAPDAWGRRVIARAHAKRRRSEPALPALSELDHLSAVDDFSRIGALRLRSSDGSFLQTVEEGRRATPPLVDLQRLFEASRAVEQGSETAEDLRYLQGKGTSLGGMRPKCTVLDRDGRLSIGKFPSVTDERSITRGEVLALRLARRAGIDAAQARIELVAGTPVAVIRRFDRSATDGRIPYLSAASMLQASRDDTHSYAEIADVIRARGAEPIADARELWRRLVFNLLITNPDDHLQNLGFLHAGGGFWRLAPAFDLNPMPDKDRESKTWLTPESGPITSLQMLLDESAYFSLDATQALHVLAEVLDGVEAWRHEARSPEVALAARELPDFENAFEHEALAAAREAVARSFRR